MNICHKTLAECGTACTCCEKPEEHRLAEAGFIPRAYTEQDQGET